MRYLIKSVKGKLETDYILNCILWQRKMQGMYPVVYDTQNKTEVDYPDDLKNIDAIQKYLEKELEEIDPTLQMMKFLILTNGPMFSGGSPESALEIAQEWVDEKFTCKQANALMDMGFWQPDIAREAVDRIGMDRLSMHRHQHDDIYKICNSDMTMDEFVERLEE